MENNYGRFIVELENNHHYVLIDTTTGYQYYTPAQDDALTICGLLNSKDEIVVNQRKQIKELKELLSKAGIKDTIQVKYCDNCRYSGVAMIGDEDCWCDIKDKSVSKNDYCNRWEKK